MRKEIWTKQPNVPVELDTAHPLYDKLVQIGFAGTSAPFKSRIITRDKTVVSVSYEPSALRKISADGPVAESSGAGDARPYLSNAEDWHTGGNTYLYFVELVGTGTTTYPMIVNGSSSSGEGIGFDGSNIRLIGNGTAILGPVAISWKKNKINTVGVYVNNPSSACRADLWFNGVRVATTESGLNIIPYGSGVYFGGVIGYTPSAVRLYGTIVLKGRITDASIIKSVSDNPWQFFKPVYKRIWRGPTVVVQGEVRYSRPVSDVAAGQWLPSTGSTLYGVVDEVTQDDADYIYTTVGSTCSMALNTVVDPNTSSNQVIYYRAKSGTSSTLVTSLMQGATTIATRTHTGLTSSFAEYQMVLTTGECDSITDYSALKIELTAV